MTPSRRSFLAGLAASPLLLPMGTAPARAANASVIDARVTLAFDRLFAEVAGARDLARRAHGILMMPDVVKGGFILGGAYGEGALRLNEGDGRYGRTAEYYSMGAASVGFQAGIQTTSHALFFMKETALNRFRRADGWEVGADAEVTFPNAGANVGIDSTTQNKPIVGVIFGQDGLLIGASLEGAKYSRIIR